MAFASCFADLCPHFCVPHPRIPPSLCKTVQNRAMTSPLSVRVEMIPKVHFERDILNVDVSGCLSQLQATQMHSDLKWSTMGLQAQEHGGGASWEGHRVACDGRTLFLLSSHLLHSSHPWTCSRLPGRRSHAKRLHRSGPTVSNILTHLPQYLGCCHPQRIVLMYSMKLAQGKSGLVLDTGLRVCRETWCLRVVSKGITRVR